MKTLRLLGVTFEVIGNTYENPELLKLGMPPCTRFRHLGEDHDWNRNRRRGKCNIGRCACRGYVPHTTDKEPPNRRIGRLLRTKDSRR